MITRLILNLRNGDFFGFVTWTKENPPEVILKQEGMPNHFYLTSLKDLVYTEGRPFGVTVQS